MKAASEHAARAEAQPSAQVAKVVDRTTVTMQSLGEGALTFRTTLEDVDATLAKV
jgi:hypothetical protein